FCTHSKADYVDYLLLEDQAIYMNFFDCMFRNSRKKSLQSYYKYWRCLCQYCGLFARRRLNDNVYGQMRRFLNQVIPAECKVPRRMKAKNTLDVGVFCITYRHHWLWSVITGTRPGVLLSQDASSATRASLGKRKRDPSVESDLPNHVSLYHLKDPDSRRDVLCAVIEFDNPKGRPEGADGTKFFMHGNYQLAYCPITQIISYAFQLIWRLRISKRSQSLRLRWEPENLDTPLLRRLERTPYGFRLHKSLLMTYDSSQRALQELGRDARFEEDIGHYNYRRWTGNGVNRNVTSQERQRVLGQSGDAVFEKHYQSQFIGRDLQHVVLLRPPQEGLLQLAGSMPRKRNLFGLSSQLTNAQRRAICQTGTVEKAQELFAHLHERNEEVKKELSQLRKTMTKSTQETARKA
ncbi:hypothetical protein ASPNIDRAFT_119967, partial [Aspergillus niger ATCC 1015]